MNFTSFTGKVTFPVLLFLSIQLSGQDRLFLENCVSPPVPQAAGTTLCEDIGEFEPDIVIGQHASSVTFVSTLTNTVNWFGTDSYFYKKIEIHGRLILDEPLFFFLCDLKMGNNAEIITLGDNHLFGQGANFFACDNRMWKGITGQQGGKVILYSCKVEDALNAISAEEATKLSLLNNIFNRNVVGLRNTNGAPGTGALLIDNFNNNSFTSTSELNNGDARGFTGIQLNNCVADIGAFNWSNTFDGLMYGIHAEESVVSVKGGTFRNIPYTPEDGGGVGIYVKDGSLSVEGVYVAPLDAIWGQSHFEACGEAGILAEGSNLIVRHNNFESNTFAVLSYDNFYAENIDISYNDILLDVEFTIGIGVIRSIASGDGAHNVISNNNVTMELGGLGIFATGEFPALDQMLIEDNHFNVTEMFTNKHLTCINVMGGPADQFKVRHNDIEFNCIFGIMKDRKGIAMTNASGLNHEISFNTPITGVENDFPVNTGIRLEQALNVTMCSNSVDWTQEGIQIIGDCDNANISRNSIGHHRYGLLIGNALYGGITGIQDRKGNTWLPEYNYEEWAAYHTGTDDEILASLFLVESTDPSIYPVQVSPGDEEWFRFTGGEKNYCADLDSDSPPFTPKETAILQNVPAVQFGATEATYWDMSRQLSLRGRLQPSLAAEVISPSTFFSAQNSASYTKAAVVEHEFRILAELTATVETELQDARQTQMEALEALMTLNAERELPEEIEDVDEAHLSAKLLHIQTIKEALSTERQLQETLQHQYELALDAISALPIMADATSHNATYENAYRELQTFKVKRLRGTNTSADLAQVLTLAAQDPTTHGLAAMGAQIYAPLCEQPTEGPSRAPQTNTGENLSSPDVAVARSLKIVPNPAKGNVQIQFNHSAFGKLRLLNMQGQLIAEQQIKEQQHINLDMQSMLPGVYIVHYLTEEGQTISKKLIIE
ncbi:MAG: T9SS type A sorting domain-containing protein [Bacteroidota bacterium]